MRANEFCQTLTTELHSNERRREAIDETRKALALERRALEERSHALTAVGALFESSQPHVEQARTAQARLNPVGLYRSSQRVVDKAFAAAEARLGAAGIDAIDEEH